MTRREFLESMIKGSMTTALLVFGSSEITLSASTVRVRINLPNGWRIVSMTSGNTVLTAIRSGFAYSETRDGTIINGLRGSWKYRVNGYWPNVYAGNYRLNANCTVDLARM